MTANADCESDIPDEIISSDGTKDSTDDKEKVTDEGQLLLCTSYIMGMGSI